MSKITWTLIVLGAIDLMIIILHVTGNFILFLKPTGYIVPLILNIIVLSIIGFRTPHIQNDWMIVGLVVFIPILLLHSIMILLSDHHYTKIDSPHNQQSLVIEYRDFTLGETTYSYDFYKTRFGLIGKKLDDQSITIVIGGTEYPEKIDAEDVLGVDRGEWPTKDFVRFSTLKGVKEVHLKASETVVKSEERKMEQGEEMEAFIKMVEEKEDGQSIMINGNVLTIRFDEPTGQSWIDVTSDHDEGAIPRQQCSRIIRNEEQGYYMLEECTHKWEYLLSPLEGNG